MSICFFSLGCSEVGRRDEGDWLIADRSQSELIKWKERTEDERCPGDMMKKEVPIYSRNCTRTDESEDRTFHVDRLLSDGGAWPHSERCCAYQGRIVADRLVQFSRRESISVRATLDSSFVDACWCAVSEFVRVWTNFAKNRKANAVNRDYPSFPVDQLEEGWSEEWRGWDKIQRSTIECDESPRRMICWFYSICKNGRLSLINEYFIRFSGQFEEALMDIFKANLM